MINISMGHMTFSAWCNMKIIKKSITIAQELNYNLKVMHTGTATK